MPRKKTEMRGKWETRGRAALIGAILGLLIGLIGAKVQLAVSIGQKSYSVDALSWPLIILVIAVALLFDYAYEKGREAAEVQASAERSQLESEHKEAFADCLELMHRACQYHGIDFWLLKSYFLKYGNDFMRSEYQWPETSKAGRGLR